MFVDGQMKDRGDCLVGDALHNSNLGPGGLVRLQGALPVPSVACKLTGGGGSVCAVPGDA